jgi:hypothetical protein
MARRAKLHMTTACISLGTGTPQTAIHQNEKQESVRLHATRLQERKNVPLTDITIAHRFDFEDPIALCNGIKGLKDRFQ